MKEVRRATVCAALGLALVLGISTLAAAEDLNVHWKTGVRGQSEDKAFSFKWGGRIMVDFGWVDVDEALDDPEDPLEDWVEFRRARLFVEGLIYENIEFKAQYDFGGGEAAFKDVYLGIKTPGPFSGIRIGHFKQPFSLEEQTSSKYITLMERSPLNEAFTPGRDTGLMAHGHALDERMTYAFGVFRPADDFGEFQGDEYAITGRVTGLVVDRDNTLVHVGGALSHAEAPDDELRFRARPSAHGMTRLVNTDHFEADSTRLYGLEAAAVFGPASVQGEYIIADVDSAEGGDPQFHGWYVEASWFITGESRPYKKSTGAFDRVKPHQNLGENGGFGAVQLTARYSTLDLNDGTIEGGEMDDIAVGVNWYLNPNTRIMLNYVNADVAGEGEANIFEMRFQIDW